MIRTLEELKKYGNVRNLGVVNAISGKDTRGVKPMDDAIKPLKKIGGLKIMDKMIDDFNISSHFSANAKSLNELDDKFIRLSSNSSVGGQIRKVKMPQTLFYPKKPTFKELLQDNSRLKDIIEKLQDKYDAILHLLNPDRVREHEYIQKREQEDNKKEK